MNNYNMVFRPRIPKLEPQDKTHFCSERVKITLSVLFPVTGLAHRTPFQTFAKKYSLLSPRKVRSKEERGYEDCKVILETLMRKVDRSKVDVMFGSWILGKTCVFYR